MSAIRPTTVHLNIDKLVLRGFAPGDRGPMVEALKTELSRLLANPRTRAALAANPRLPVLRVPQVDFTPGPSGSRALGRSVAARIVAPAGRSTQP